MFTSSNLLDLNSSALNALITLIPNRFSPPTPLILSINFCTLENFGNTTIINDATVVIRIITQTPVSTDHSKPLFNIFRIAHTAIIGAFTIICSPKPIIISTCVISFVVRVIKLLTENFFISLTPNLNIFLNNISLRVAAKLDAVVAAKNPTIIAEIKLPPAHSNI